MKRLTSILVTAAVALTALVGCGGNTEINKNNVDQSGVGSEISMIIDSLSSIEDKSFNQGTYEGIIKFVNENNKTYNYYRSKEDSVESYITNIELAIQGGAKTVICPSYLFENAIYQVQSRYPDVNFIIIDGSPKDENGVEFIADNTSAIVFKEEESGFLAGYSAVKDGYKNLGFMGGLPLPTVVRFGYGFTQGAEYAAKELGLANGDINLKYTYVGNFSATPENTATASSWYNEGTEIIFACGGAMFDSVVKAAETTNGKVIGVDVDKSSESEVVVTSAMKNITNSAYTSLQNIYNGTFQGGVMLNLGVETENVLLPMETSRFKTFTQEDYDNIYQKLVNSEVEILKDTDVTDVKELPLEIIKVSSY